MVRITQDMSEIEAAIVIIEGNKEALCICGDLLRMAHSNTSLSDKMYFFKALDELGIYGSQICELYGQVCQKQLATFAALLICHNLGLGAVNTTSVQHAIIGSGSLDLDEICRQGLIILDQPLNA